MQAENIRALSLAESGLKAFAILTRRLLDVGNFDIGMFFLVFIYKRLDDRFRFPQSPPSEVGRVEAGESAEEFNCQKAGADQN